MLIPPPLPTYALAPGMAPLTPAQERALAVSLSHLTGRLSGVVVTSAGTTLSHHVIELLTSAGLLLVLERVEAEPVPEAVAA